MNKRIMFSAFDGTLYVNCAVSQANREAVRRWRAAGNLFAMASGRYVAALREHMEAEGVEYDYLLCLNGAEAYDCENHLLFETPIDIRILPGLFDTFIQGDGWANVCYGERGERVMAEKCSDFNPDHPHYPKSHLATFSHFTQICSGLKDMAAARAASERILAQFGDSVSTQINGRNLDVNAAGVNKSAGIRRMIDALGISSDQVVTIGDNFNDLSMLTAFQGYAVAHAPAEVQRQAHGVVSDVAELIDLLLKHGD